MSPHTTRIRIESEILGRLEKRTSEEEQANLLMSLLMDNYPLHAAGVLALDQGGRHVLFAHRGHSGKFIKELYAKGTLPIVEAAAAGEVVLQGADPRLSDPAWRFEHEAKSAFGAPCRLQGETVGVFLAGSREPDFFVRETLEAFRAYARLSAVLLGLRSLQQKVSRVPDIDSVTGMRNFRFFHEVLHQELTRGKKFGHPVSLMFIRVRHLREMNEVFGHVAADNALVELARVVQSRLREVDYAARSGSMIYVVMPQMGKAEAAKLASGVLDALTASPLGRREVMLKTAIGVASFPKDGDSERILLPHVEAMVHESIRRGDNVVTVYGD